MRRSESTEAQVAMPLRQHEAGTTVGEICRKLEISETSDIGLAASMAPDRWRDSYRERRSSVARTVVPVLDHRATPVSRLIAD